jgi:hypothetical protein
MSTKVVRNAKEESFGSSLSRKACGELERQSLSVKARKRRGNNLSNSRQFSDPVKKAGGHQKRWSTKLSLYAISLGEQTARARRQTAKRL